MGAASFDRLARMPGKRTPEIENAILAALETGESLRKSCEAAGITAPAFLKWCDEDSHLGKRYAQARARGADAEFEALQQLAEEAPPVDANGRIDNAWIQWQRLRVDTRKWALSKKRPERYGDRIDHQHGTTEPLLIQINLGGKRDESARIIDQAPNELPQLPLVTR